MGLKISSVQTGVVYRLVISMATPIFWHFSYYFFTLARSDLQLWLKATSERIFCCDMTSILFSITSHAKKN